MRRSLWLIIVVALLVLSQPQPVLAWGPAIHVGLAESALAQLALLPAAVAALLARHRMAFIYGNISADVVFAKRLSRIKQFCHHWSTGFRLLQSAPDDRAQAFAYGYLSHLAADTVAHGKYVPRQIALHHTSVNFGHMYWELRADETASAPILERLANVLDQDHADFHRLLRQHIADTFLTYSLNRLVFGGMNALCVRTSFRRTIEVLDRYSRWTLSPALIERYRAECLERMISVLTEGERSAVLKEDPNGTSALMELRVRRREQRRLRRQGMPVEYRRREASHTWSPTRPSDDLERPGKAEPPVRI
jgi:hypothetical protein